MKKLRTRADKIKFLNDLHRGKASLQEILNPITGMIVINDGKVIMETTISGTREFSPGIDLDEYESKFTGRISHRAFIENYSKPKEQP